MGNIPVLDMQRGKAQKKNGVEIWGWEGPSASIEGDSYRLSTRSKTGGHLQSIQRKGREILCEKTKTGKRSDTEIADRDLHASATKGHDPVLI